MTPPGSAVVTAHTSPTTALQVAPSTVVAVVGTFLLFAAFLAITAHVAARNVLGDVAVADALLVGPVPALVSMVGVGIGAFPLLVAVAALVCDFAAVERVYDLERRTAAYVTFIHAVVTVILMAVVGGLIVLVAQGPPSGEPPTGVVLLARLA